MLPCGEAGSHGHPGPSLGHSLICTSRRWPAVLQTQCWTSAGGPARAGGAAGGSGLAAVTGGFRDCPRRSRSGPPGKRSPAAGRRAAGADLAPAREDLVTQCASSATAPARLPPARAASLPGEGPSRESRGLHGGSGRSGFSHEEVPARRLCLVPPRTPPLRRRRRTEGAPGGVPWGRGHRNGGVAAARGRPLPSPAAQSCRASEGAAFRSGKASA